MPIYAFLKLKNSNKNIFVASTKKKIVLNHQSFFKRNSISYVWMDVNWRLICWFKVKYIFVYNNVFTCRRCITKLIVYIYFFLRGWLDMIFIYYCFVSITGNAFMCSNTGMLFIVCIRLHVVTGETPLYSVTLWRFPI